MRDQKRILPCAAWLEGEYGMSGLFLGVPCKLGREGLEKIIEVELTDEERAALEKSADAVREPMARRKAVIADESGGFTLLPLGGRQESRNGGDGADRSRLRDRAHAGNLLGLPRPGRDQRLFAFSQEHRRAALARAHRADRRGDSSRHRGVSAHDAEPRGAADRLLRARAAGRDTRVAHDAMGRRIASHFHRPSHPAFHDGHDLGRRDSFSEGDVYAQRRRELPHLVGRAVLRRRDDRARAAPLSRRMELGAHARRRAAVDRSAAPASRACHRCSLVWLGFTAVPVAVFAGIVR